MVCSVGYTREAVIEDADGGVQMSGRDENPEELRGALRELPEPPGGGPVANSVGSYVVDEENVSGLTDNDFHAIAIYTLDHAGLIRRVRVLR